MYYAQCTQYILYELYGKKPITRRTLKPSTVPHNQFVLI